jgi:quercetin 2,3-dioxygenase
VKTKGDFMIQLRKSNERGSADHGWLKAKHTFSFANYYDESNMGFRSLRVINEDRVNPRQGFPTHAHRDMEIITYIIDGNLEHKDSMGNGSVISAGEVQYMSAGNGVRHSEFNPNDREPVHLLQIWILPDKVNYLPTYDQRAFSPEIRKNTLKLVATGDELKAKNQGAIKIRQDVDVYASLLNEGRSIEYKVGVARGVWIQLIRGTISVNGAVMSTGDGAKIENENILEITSVRDAEFLLFDLH